MIRVAISNIVFIRMTHGFVPETGIGTARGPRFPPGLAKFTHPRAIHTFVGPPTIRTVKYW